MQTLQEMMADEASSIGQYVTSRMKDLLSLHNQGQELEAGIAAIHEVNADERHSVWAYVSGGRVYARIAGLTSFSQVGEYLRAIRKMMASKVEARQRYELEYSCRVGLLSLSFQVNGQGATCRRVQVGTRTEEVPVYEVVCDDPADAAQAGGLAVEGE